MKSDLKDLLISEKEFKKITGVNIDDIKDMIASEKNKHFLKIFLNIFFEFWIYLCCSILILSIILLPLVWFLFYGLQMIIVGLQLSWSLALKIAAYISVPLGTVITFGTFSDKKERRKALIHLRQLFSDFERYSQVIQAIDVKDKLEAVEIGETNFEGREYLLETLKEMKQDLIRALKVERILRENKKIVELNPEIFESSFTAIRVEKINERGSEYSHLINETLKIGVHVRSEMSKMKNSGN